MDAHLGLAGVAATSFAICLWLTSQVRSLARRWNFVDEPDGRRKTHIGVVPLGGGLAIGVSVLATVCLYSVFSTEFIAILRANVRFLLGLLAGSLVMGAVGLVDDRTGLSGRQKLLGQLVAIALLISGSGISVARIGIFGASFDLGVLAIPFVIFWLLGAVNAFNLMDGIDGLAATIGAVTSFALAGMCLIGDRHADALLAVSLGGALGGFLRFNLPPASIFLGDTGSMLIGFVVGALALHSSLKGPTTVALAAPVAILAIPILDSTAAILRRKLTGKSLYATDRGHMHHVIMSKGYSNVATVAIIATATVGTSIAAILSVYWRNDYLAETSVVVVTLLFVVNRLFGYGEYLLVRDLMLDLSAGLVRFGRREVDHRENVVHVQGSKNWNVLWANLRRMVEPHVVQMKLDIDLPQVQEGFHARWKRSNFHDRSFACTQVVPIVVEGHPIGRLELVALVGDVDVQTILQNALLLCRSAELEAATLLKVPKSNDSIDRMPETKVSAPRALAPT